VSENVEIRIDNCREMETAKAALQWRSTGLRSLGISRRTVHVPRPTLDRDRRDTGSLVLVNESVMVASCLANERIKNCEHEENRSAANAREYNQSDHTKHGIRASYCTSSEQQSLVVFFYQTSGRAHASLLPRRYRLRFLSQFLCLSRFV
jgi:hypothetical protein